MKIVIVGGVAGGASVAARARRLDESAEIILFERGEYVSYANCGLPYYIGGVIEDRDELFLQTPQSLYKRFRIDVRVREEVVSVDKKAHQVKVRKLQTGEEYTESYDKLVLSPGAEPFVPDGIDASLQGVYTLRSVNDTLKIKELVDGAAGKKAVVVGGGFIGLEMAENLKAKGVEVTIIEAADQLFPPFDKEMAGMVKHEFEKNGVKIMLNSPIKGVTKEGDAYQVSCTNGTTLSCDFVILAIGVRPDAHLAADAGIALNARGAIVTNEMLLTDDPDVYAAGDAIETLNLVSGERVNLPLAGPANKQGRLIAANITGEEKTEFKGIIGSSVVKIFSQTMACTGLNEKTLKRLGTPYEKIYCSPSSHAGYYPGGSQLTIKLFFAPDGKVLGCQIAGTEGVEKRIDVIATAIKFGATVSDLAELELCYAPPYSSAKDPVNYAGFIAENALTGRGPVKHWDMLDARDPETSVLLDVRTPGEYAKGALPDSVNIPVDELRERLSELPKDKEIWVYCQVGLRGYIGQRILMQSGFDKVYNVSGGYRLMKVCGVLPQK